MALEDDLDPLYACPLGEFLDRRKALAQALRKAGRKDDASRAASAAKPTPAAWAVNQLARGNPEEMTALFASGERLRALVRATFTGQADATAMSEARSAQRDIVTRLTRLASRHLESAGASPSPAVQERIAATLTTISTTGAWAGAAPAQLTRELDPPSLDTLATLVGDLAPASPPARPAPAETAATPARDTVAEKAPASPSNSSVRADTTPEQKKAQAEEAARRAAAEAQARIERAESALRAATANEEKHRSAAEQARAAAALATSQREKRESAAREARRIATEHEQAAEEARRKAESAIQSAREAESGSAAAARDEQSAKTALADAEKAFARAAAESIAAEETVVRERRGAARPVE